MGKTKTCLFCGKAHPFEKGKCPAWGAKCTKCGGRNYLATTCTAPTRKVYNLRDESSDDSDLEYITSIVTQSEMIHTVTQGHVYPKVIYTEMIVGKTEVKFHVDSGATVNAIPVRFSVEFLVVDRQLTSLIEAKAVQQMGLITLNTRNFKIAKPPERQRTEVKSVQTADEIVAGYPEVFQREQGTLFSLHI